MKPTINTSPLVASCTTAGIRPSSLVKSIPAYRSQNPATKARRHEENFRKERDELFHEVIPSFFCGFVARFAARSKTKKPAGFRRAYVGDETKCLATRAIRPARLWRRDGGRDARGDESSLERSS